MKGVANILSWVFAAAFMVLLVVAICNLIQGNSGMDYGAVAIVLLLRSVASNYLARQ
jgi:hypothetical protein